MSVKITEQKKVWFKKIKQSQKIFNKEDLIKSFCINKDVLDVGCVGQDVDYNNPNWIHNQVKEVSNSLIGVDIDLEGINNIRKMGYEVYHYNEMKIENKFDVILILDVIEHVNNPIEFLKDYTKFLKEDGKIIITTPNSNRAINFVNIFFKNDYSLNYEHTFWFCPKTFLEVVDRVDVLEASEFYWLKHYNKNQKLNWKNKIIYYIDKLLIKKSNNFSPNFMFVLKVKK
jgi:2-polyprenyl-3-methyl-5-hydroxy-6-metoxy-1,4-benzoquinol methylase